MRYAGVIVCWLALIAPIARGQDAAAPKPKVAVFPLAGTAPADLRQRIGFSIRAKLDRDGAYDPIDGPTMADMAGPTPIGFGSAAQVVTQLAQGSGAVVLIWGDVSPDGGKDALHLKTLDLRDKQPAAREFQETIPDPDQIRWVVEKFLQTLPGMKAFVRPNEEPVHHDPASDALFAGNPNLVVDGDFSSAGHWVALYELEKYAVPIGDAPPAVDKVAIYSPPNEKGEKALAMNLSLVAAQNNGLACLSDAIAIEPGVRYRLSFRYKSDGPLEQVFVKGYTPGKSLAGQPEDQEVYRLQAPPGFETRGRWQTVQADLDPQNPDHPVQRLRVDLYACLYPGTILFDDVQLKVVGRQAIPATQAGNP